MSPDHIALQAAVDVLVEQWREQSIDITAHHELVPA